MRQSSVQSCRVTDRNQKETSPGNKGQMEFSKYLKDRENLGDEITSQVGAET